MSCVLNNSSVLNNPEMVEAVFVEGTFFLYLRSDLPETCGFASKSILRKLCSSFSAKSIDNVFDKVVTPSIKGNERTWYWSIRYG